VLLKNGRGLALEGAVKDAPAILVTWFLGSETGHAIADVLFGAIGPSGRLPLSFPHESGQEPYYYAHKATGRPAPEGERVPYKTQWRTAPNAALYPFGHGLTYGRIGYGALTVPATLAWDGRIEVATTVTNSGTRPCEEVVQLYIRDRVASITRPVRELKAFSKIALAPGASSRVAFTLTRAQLEFLGADLRPTVEPGTFDVWIAPSAQADGAHGTFDLVR
jgi:beta-glucosidase